MRHHIGRSFEGHRLEDQCPCPQEPCGLIDTMKAVEECKHHVLGAGATIRQAHPANTCPAKPDAPEVTPLGEYGEDWLVTGTSDAHSAEEAVRASWKEELNDEDYQEQYGDVQLGDLQIEYRDDWAWKRYPGRYRWEPLDEGDELVSGTKGNGLQRFAGFMVRL